MRFDSDRPRSIPEILDDAVGLFRANAGLLVAAGGVVLFPAGLLLGLVQVGYQVAVAGALGGDGVGGAELATVLVAISMLLAAVSVYALAAAFARAVLITAAARLHAGEKASVKELYGFVWKRAFAFLVTEFLVMTGAGIALLFLLIPGLVLAVLWSLAGVVVLVEGPSLFDAMSRSFQLVKNHFWRVAGLMVAAGVLAWVIQAIITAPAQGYLLWQILRTPEAILRPGGVTVYSGLQGILAAAAAVIVMPIAELVTVGIFVDLRVRREGEDIVAAIEALA